MTVRYTPRTVGEADVEGTLAGLADSRATLVTAARPARTGDFVVVDYELALEGEAPRAEQGYAFEIGSGRVLPEMDEAVVGLEAGAERQIPLRLPESHPREGLRGKAGQLRLRVVEVKEKELPLLDDDFAKTLGAHETLAELRAAIRAEIEGQRVQQNRRHLEEAVVDATLERHDVAVPESLVLREIATGAKWKSVSDPDMMLVHVILPKAEEVAATPEATAAAATATPAEPEVIKKGKKEEEEPEAAKKEEKKEEKKK